eukprot:27577_1
MSSLVKWGQQNPKKAALLSLIGLYSGYNKYKEWSKVPKDLNGKIVLVTGGASGLGKLVALRLINEGCKVIVWDVNKQSLKECNNEGKLIAKFVDVTNKSSVDKSANELLSKYGKLDILVQNAGVAAGRPLLQLTEKDIRTTYNVNIISHYWTLKAFLPSMLKNKSGHIVNTISTSALCPVSHLTDYSATKAAARALDISLKRELMDLEMDEGIVITGIYPSYMDTGMFEGAKYNNSFGSTLITGKDLLDPKYVADEVIEAIKYEKRQVVLPKALGKWFSFVQHLSHELQDENANSAQSMKGFVGGKNRLSKL